MPHTDLNNSRSNQEIRNSETVSFCSQKNVKEEENNDERFAGRSFVGTKEAECVISQNDDDWYYYNKSVNKCNNCSEHFSTMELLSEHRCVPLEKDNKVVLGINNGIVMIPLLMCRRI